MNAMPLPGSKTVNCKAGIVPVRQARNLIFRRLKMDNERLI